MDGPYTLYDFRHPWNAATQWLRWVKGKPGLGPKWASLIDGPGPHTGRLTIHLIGFSIRADQSVTLSPASVADLLQLVHQARFSAPISIDRQASRLL